MFIADLPSFLADEGCQGVPLHDTWVRVLLYADDGALTASSAADLQRMLDALWQYCRRWRMIVNVKKTEIVVFNRKKLSVREYRFNYNNETITIVEKFKYLGVMFHEKRKYAISIEYRLSQAKRLIAAWVRRCRIWLFKPDVVVNQFMTCILPALEYGVALWGVGKRWGEIGAWKDLESFWYMVARTIINAPLRSPSEGVFGELGWYPYAVRAGWQAASFWTRVSGMSKSSLTWKAMYVQRGLLDRNKRCWLNILRDTLKTTQSGYLYWNKWWNSDDFMDQTCLCKRYDIEFVNNKVVIRMIPWETDIYEDLKRNAANSWLIDINREEAKRGRPGKNKLRTYATFKTDWGYESYLSIIEDGRKRNLLTKLRIGVCPLRIESGRFEGGKYLPSDLRLCLCCNSQHVEDEFHFIMECPVYENLRSILFQDIEIEDVSFHHILSDIKRAFVYLMSSKHRDNYCSSCFCLGSF